MLRRRKHFAPLDTTDEDEVQFHATNTVAERMPAPPDGCCGLMAVPLPADPED